MVWERALDISGEPEVFFFFLKDDESDKAASPDFGMKITFPHSSTLTFSCINDDTFV